MRKFLKLPWAEQWLLFRAWRLVLFMRVMVLTVPFSRLQSLACRLAGVPRVDRNRTHQADRLAWAVAVASRFVPGATCLPQALAGRVLFSREGYPADIHVGVAKTPDSQFKAHAWLESEGRVVIGKHEVETYQPILKMEGTQA
jgi:hypothetical protein